MKSFSTIDQYLGRNAAVVNGTNGRSRRQGMTPAGALSDTSGNQLGQPSQHFEGAAFTRLTAKLNSICKTPVEELQNGVLRVLRARSRWLCNNAAIAAGFKKTLRRRVVGAGLSFQPQQRGPDGMLLRSENLELAAEFVNYCRDISARGHKSHKLFGIIVDTFVSDGEVFMQRVDNPDKEIPREWALIDSDQIAEDETELTLKIAPGNHVALGIEMTKAGRPVAYHVYDDGVDAWGAGSFNRSVRRIPADQIVHWSNGSRYGSPQGVPCMTPVILLLADDEDFRKAVLTKAWVQACMTAFISATDPGAAEDAFNIVDVDGTDSGGVTDYNQNYQGMEIPFGTVTVLDNNTVVTMAGQTSPPQNMREFNSCIGHAMAAGLGISYLALMRDLTGVSYSGGRQAENEDRLFYQDIALDIDGEILYEIWRDFVAQLYAIKWRRVPSAIDPYAVLIQHPQPREIDPVKGETANTLAIENFTTSRTRVAGDKGADFYQVVDERRAEEDYAKEQGFDLSVQPSDVAQAVASGPAMAPEEDEEDAG